MNFYCSSIFLQLHSLCFFCSWICRIFLPLHLSHFLVVAFIAFYCSCIYHSFWKLHSLHFFAVEFIVFFWKLHLSHFLEVAFITFFGSCIYCIFSAAAFIAFLLQLHLLHFFCSCIFTFKTPIFSHKQWTVKYFLVFLHKTLPCFFAINWFFSAKKYKIRYIFYAKPTLTTVFFTNFFLLSIFTKKFQFAKFFKLKIKKFI